MIQKRAPVPNRVQYIFTQTGIPLLADAVKPHLTLWRSFGVAMWRCDGLGIKADGATPQVAFRVWSDRVMGQ